MNMRTCCLVVLISIIPVLAVSNFAHAQEPERLALQHYQGVWASKFEIVPPAETAPAQVSTGDVEGKWVVGDRFMEQTGSYRLGDDAAPMVIKTLMSFDQENDRYRYDYFVSSGEIHQSYGHWDEVKKTMTSTITNSKAKTVSTIVADFSTENIERWTIETKNEEGKTLTKLKGTNTRRLTR